MKITLARALSYKKRLIGEFNKVNNTIKINNSLESSKRKAAEDIDVKGLLSRREQLRSALLHLKSSVSQANHSSGQYERIFNLSELKDDLTFWSSLNTVHGEFKELSYGLNAPVSMTYDAVVKRSDAESKVDSLNKEIDALQEEIERVNYSTFIEIEDVGLI